MNEKLTEQSVESQDSSTKESINTYEFRSQVREEIGSLREKVDQILKALNAKNDCDPEVIWEEIHRYPTDGQDFVRCAMIGLIRGDEYSRFGQAIFTTRVDNIFDNPNTTPEKVAAFVSQLANPALIDVCRRMSQGYRCRSELKMICDLTDDELDNALEPLLEWGIPQVETGRGRTQPSRGGSWHPFYYPTDFPNAGNTSTQRGHAFPLEC